MTTRKRQKTKHPVRKSRRTLEDPDDPLQFMSSLSSESSALDDALRLSQQALSFIEVCDSHRDSHSIPLAALFERMHGDIGSSIEEAGALGKKRILIAVDTETDVIAGCLVYERRQRAERLEEREEGEGGRGKRKRGSCLLGVSHVWVDPGFRRTGVAAAMVDQARGLLVYGFLVAVEDTVFSQLSSMGKLFARSYLGVHDVFVY